MLRLWAALLARLPGRGRTGTPQRILVIRLGNLGDMIVALPAMHALRNMFPDARLTLLTSPTKRGAPGALEVLKNDATFERLRVYYADEPGRLGFLKGLRDEIAREGVDLAVVLPNQLTGFGNVAKFMALLSLSGVRRVIGAELVTPVDFDRYQVDRLVGLLEPLCGAGATGAAQVEPFPWLAVSTEDRAVAEELLAPLGARPLIGMHCGAKRPANRWAPESFAEVGRRLVAEEGAGIVLTGAPGDKDLVASVAEGIGEGCLDLAGQTDIGQLGAVAERCRVFVSNDTGVMHVAYAVGTPVAAIFGERFYPSIWYPYGEGSIVLRKDVDCALCNAEICPLYDYPKCLELITPDEVIGATRTILHGKENASPA